MGRRWRLYPRDMMSASVRAQEGDGDVRRGGFRMPLIGGLSMSGVGGRTAFMTVVEGVMGMYARRGVGFTMSTAGEDVRRARDFFSNAGSGDE